MLSKLFASQSKDILLLAQDMGKIAIEGENAPRKSLEPMTILRDSESDVKKAMELTPSERFFIDQLNQILNG
jgi:hypothetical protein